MLLRQLERLCGITISLPSSLATMKVSSFIMARSLNDRNDPLLTALQSTPVVAPLAESSMTHMCSGVLSLLSWYIAHREHMRHEHQTIIIDRIITTSLIAMHHHSQSLSLSSSSPSESSSSPIIRSLVRYLPSGTRKVVTKSINPPKDHSSEHVSNDSTGHDDTNSNGCHTASVDDGHYDTLWQLLLHNATNQCASYGHSGRNHIISLLTRVISPPCISNTSKDHPFMHEMRLLHAFQTINTNMIARNPLPSLYTAVGSSTLLINKKQKTTVATRARISAKAAPKRKAKQSSTSTPLA